MSVSGLEALAGFTPLAPANLTSAAATARPQATSGPDFGELVTSSIDNLDGVQRTADRLAVAAATGELENLHDYTIAATQAQVATQVTVAVRNKAVEAFNEIMRMQVG